MVFSSSIFLFIFLPVSVAVYFLIPAIKFKNLYLVIISLIFYSWKSEYLILLTGTIVVNYCFGLIIEKFRERKFNFLIIIAMIIWNFGILYYFKYTMFTINSINSIFELNLTLPNIIAPLGISFITFRAVSYCLDIYFQACNANKNIISVALYMAFFPQILSGPITKYNQFEPYINNREHSTALFTEGLERFIIGLAKKVLIADNIAPMVAAIFSTEPSERTVVMALVGSISFLIQLYFDFSGYSDMAIGIGKMFGFKTPENFNYPYLSKSVVEFWNRWHITLGTWVKDYMYVPLYRSLSQKTNIFTGKKLEVSSVDSISLFFVWIFIGFWHGAGWLFLLYGMIWYFFIFIERRYDAYKTKKRKKLKQKKQPLSTKEKILAHIYLLLVLLFVQTLFRSSSIYDWTLYIRNMLAINTSFINEYSITIIQDNIYLLIIGIIASLPVSKYAADKFGENRVVLYLVIKRICLTALFILSLIWMISSTNVSFIYFQF